MADNDNINKSKKGSSVNGVDAFSEIEKILEKQRIHSGQDVIERKKLAEAIQTEKAYEQILQGGVPSELEKIILKDKAKQVNRQDVLSSRISTREVLQGERTYHQLGSHFSRHFSPSSVNGEVADIARSTFGQGLGLRMMGQSPEELEQKRMSSGARLNELYQRAMNIRGSLQAEDPNAKAELQQILTKAQREVKLQAGIEAAERKQRSLGLDIESRETRLFKMGTKASSMLETHRIEQDISSGKIKTDDKTLSDLKQQEINLIKQYLAELDKLKNASSDTAKEIRESAESIAKNLEITGEKIGQIESARGGQDGTRDTANKLNLLGSGFGAIGGAAQALLVNQRIAQTQNIAGFAQFENLKYQTYKNANAGDVMSQLLLSGFKADEAFGTELRAGQVGANTANLTGSLLQTASGAVRVAEAAAQKNPVTQSASMLLGTASTSSQNLQFGTMDVVSGAASSAVQAGDMLRRISTGQSYLSGAHASLEARKAILAIPAEQLQGLRDFGVNMGTAAMSMGSGAGASFLQRSFSKPNMVQLSGLERMANARISPEQMAQMAAFGAQEIGSTFNEGQIYSARGLERSGFGSMQENMQRMARLSGAGSNNPENSLKSVLEAAFSKSLEGSKVLNQMVEYTGAMADQSVGKQMGLDVTAAAAQILSAGVDPNAKNKEAALSVAATTAQKMQQISTDTGVNYSAMAATARISKMTGLSGVESIIAQKMKDEDLITLKKSTPNQASKILFEQGIDVETAIKGQQYAGIKGREERIKKLVQNLVTGRLITNLQMGGSGVGLGLDAEALAEKRISGQAFTRQEDLLFKRAARLAEVGIGDQALRAATAVISDEPNSATKQKAGKALSGEAGDELMKTLDDMRTQGFKQLSAAALEATAGFKNATEALKALGLLAKESENAVDKGAEGKFKDAGAKSAGDFGNSTVVFKDSVSVFKETVDKLIATAGMNKEDKGWVNWIMNKNSTKIGGIN
jgi:hypothetical protein